MRDWQNVWRVFFRWRLAALLARSCQKIKVFKLKVCSVRARSEPSKPHFLKVNFRKILFPVRGNTIGAGNQIFTINLNNFVNLQSVRRRSTLWPTSEEGLSKVHFLDSIFVNTHTSSCNHSLVSHQLNFLSQIIFSFSGSSTKTRKKFPNPPFKLLKRTSSGLEKDTAPVPVRPRHEKPGPSVSTLKFIIYNFLQSSCGPHLSLTFLRRWRPLCPLWSLSHRNWLKLYFLLPSGHLLLHFRPQGNFKYSNTPKKS